MLDFKVIDSVIKLLIEIIHSCDFVKLRNKYIGRIDISNFGGTR